MVPPLSMNHQRTFDNKTQMYHWNWLIAFFVEKFLPWIVTAVPSNDRGWRTPAVNSSVEKCRIFGLEKSCLRKMLQQFSLVAAFLLEIHLPTGGLLHQDEALGPEEGWPHLHPTFLNPRPSNHLLLLPLSCSAPPPLHVQTEGLALVRGSYWWMRWWVRCRGGGPGAWCNADPAWLLCQPTVS